MARPGAKRRPATWPRLAIVALTLTATGACGGGSSTSPSPGPSSPAGTATTRPLGGGPNEQQISRAYTDFFSGKTDAARKIALLQGGTAFSKTIEAQARSALSKSTSARVTKVTILSPTRASVTYTVSLGGTPMLTNQKGLAVKQGGAWKVGASTFCALLRLEGNPPAACASMPTASPG